MRSHANLLLVLLVLLLASCAGRGPSVSDASRRYRDAARADSSAPDQHRGADGGAAALCTSTGGSIGTSLCCASATDFPDLCAIGACSCAPSSSHSVRVCNCPSGECFHAATGCGSP